MKAQKTKLDGVMVIDTSTTTSSVGELREDWNHSKLEKLGLDYNFVQDNHSFSKQKFTVRGLHFQAPPFAQAKLVSCGRGSLLDVAVDIRQGSPTYGNWVGKVITESDNLQVLIPAGFLHGFITLESDTEIRYKCSDYYNPKSEGSVLFCDTTIGIDWQCDISKITISAKDEHAQRFEDFVSPFVYSTT